MAANYVEQATLRLNDQTSAPARQINTALRQLYRTASKLQKLNGAMQFNVSGKGIVRLRNDLSKAAVAARELNAAMAAAGRQSGRRGSVPSVTPGGRGGGGRGGGGGGNFGFSRRFGDPDGSFALLLRNVALTSAAFWVVHTAANLASSALQSLATNATKRDRAALQSAVQASQLQRDVFNSMSGDRAPQGAGAITFTATERRAFWASILGDVQGNERERAVSATNITAKLEKDLLPRLFAAQPDRSREQVLEGFKQVVKALNLASTELVDTSGKFTASGERAFQGIQLAFAANPDLDPNQVRTTLANLKTSALSLSSRELAQVLISAADRGVRAANETFRAQLSATGTVDNKALNNALARLGLLTGVERNKKGNVIAGSGRAIDQELLQTDPRAWFNKNFLPQVEKALRDQGRELSDANIISESARMLPGMSSAGRQAVADFLTGAEQMAAALNQAELALKQDVPAEIAKSWSAQGESVAIAWKDAMGKLGDEVAKGLGLGTAFGGLAALLRGDLGTGAQVAAAGGTVAAGGAAALLGGRLALGSLFAAGPALNSSAAALDVSAAALLRAAVAQGGSSVAGAAGTAGGAAAAAGAAGRLAGLARFAGWGAVATLGATLAIDWWKGGPIQQTVKDAVATATATKTAKPGEGGGSTQQLVELKTELSHLNAEIERQRAAEKIPGSSDLATQGLRNQANLVQEQINVMTAENAAKFATTFETGSVKLKEVGTTIDTAAAAFGPTASAGILAVAGPFGAAVGAAIAAAANNLSVNLKVPDARPNTGATQPVR